MEADEGDEGQDKDDEDLPDEMDLDNAQEVRTFRKGNN